MSLLELPPSQPWDDELRDVEACATRSVTREAGDFSVLSGFRSGSFTDITDGFSKVEEEHRACGEATAERPQEDEECIFELNGMSYTNSLQVCDTRSEIRGAGHLPILAGFRSGNFTDFQDDFDQVEEGHLDSSEDAEERLDEDEDEECIFELDGISYSNSLQDAEELEEELNRRPFYDLFRIEQPGMMSPDASTRSSPLPTHTAPEKSDMLSGFTRRSTSPCSTRASTSSRSMSPMIMLEGL